MSDCDDSGMEEYGTEWAANSSTMLGCVIRPSLSLTDGVRMKLNELAIALSEELTLEAEEKRQVKDGLRLHYQRMGELTF